MNNLIEPIFVAMLIGIGLSCGAIYLDNSKEIKFIAGAFLFALLTGVIVGWM
ncbi:hypothetical protein [Okeania sp. SIO1I7]|uniref:hypothetical protein n=1 Tax=Okeania sp. SIO1I7 TaxID=2607772 RepID=UPI0025D729F2|nr:hypothetical protein [Okeania sp. SIO1I7]